MTVLNMP